MLRQRLSEIEALRKGMVSMLRRERREDSLVESFDESFELIENIR